jgi:hypothetical protein
MRPSKDELRKRADAADEKFRRVSRRTALVRQLAFEGLSQALPVERLDLYGNLPAKFHAVVYFKSIAEVGTFDTGQTRSLVTTEIEGALKKVDPDASELEVVTDIDSIERMEASKEGYFDKFR